MENAIKALYMGAGVLIGVMILSVFVYMFRTGASFGETYELKKNTEQIQAFNSKFEVYDNRSVQRGDSAGYSFVTKGNTISDVISCANLIMDINEKNDYDLQNAIQLKLNIGASVYYIYPLEKLQKRNFFIADVHFDSAKGTEDAGGTLGDNKYMNFNTLLKQYNNVRIVNIVSTGYNSTNETIYQWYFDVPEEGITYSEVTGKVTSITFTRYETKEFDNNDKWQE